MLLLQPHHLWGARTRHVSVCAHKDDRSRKGNSFESNKRRRGRPAWKRDAYDTPLRDGNRDRLIGLLTERATKTLLVYLMELNPNHYSWLVEFYQKNPIPKIGSWDDVSGETFLRTLLSMPIEEATFRTGREDLFNNSKPMGVDPRNLAMRIMDIRSQLAKEFIQDLSDVAEENSTLMRETLTSSLQGFSLHPTATADASTEAQPEQEPASAQARPKGMSAALRAAKMAALEPDEEPEATAPAAPALLDHNGTQAEELQADDWALPMSAQPEAAPPATPSAAPITPQPNVVMQGEATLGEPAQPELVQLQLQAATAEGPVEQHPALPAEDQAVPELQEVLAEADSQEQSSEETDVAEEERHLQRAEVQATEAEEQQLQQLPGLLDQVAELSLLPEEAQPAVEGEEHADMVMAAAEHDTPSEPLQLPVVAEAAAAAETAALAEGQPVLPAPEAEGQPQVLFSDDDAAAAAEPAAPLPEVGEVWAEATEPLLLHADPAAVHSSDEAHGAVVEPLLLEAPPADQVGDVLGLEPSASEAQVPVAEAEEALQLGAHVAAEEELQFEPLASQQEPEAAEVTSTEYLIHEEAQAASITAQSKQPLVEEEEAVPVEAEIPPPVEAEADSQAIDPIEAQVQSPRHPEVAEEPFEAAESEREAKEQQRELLARLEERRAARRHEEELERRRIEDLRRTEEERRARGGNGGEEPQLPMHSPGLQGAGMLGRDRAAVVAALYAAFNAELPTDPSSSTHPEVRGDGSDGGGV